MLKFYPVRDKRLVEKYFPTQQHAVGMQHYNILSVAYLRHADIIVSLIFYQSFIPNGIEF
jgi:hypothetical protein